MNNTYDKIILGAGMYGLYSAVKSGIAGQKIIVLEYDNTAFSRATYINQARVHMGYHYPRSLSTAEKSAGYYHRFYDDFYFAIRGAFRQIYATSASFSWTNAKAFQRFCKAAKIKCEEVAASEFFNPKVCDGAFLVEEDTYDAHIIRRYFLEKISGLPNVEIKYNVRLEKIINDGNEINISYSIDGENTNITSSYLLNATYASANQILDKVENKENIDGFDFKKFNIKYEQCEIILCSVNEKMSDVGLTVMDGPFFSIMPFGKTGLHSLTAVTFTPHATCYNDLPYFSCQDGKYCSKYQLGNCNECKYKPTSAWEHMSRLAKKYVKPEYEFSYESSLYSMKPILKASEIDDSRPTTIVVNSEQPKIVSVLSGKINTVYDLDDYLEV